MGTVVAAYSESRNRFFSIKEKSKLTLQGRRKLLGSSLRYCIGGEYVYIPAAHPELPDLPQLCWARIHSTAAMELPEIGDLLPDNFDIFSFVKDGGCRIGDRYIKRRREETTGMVDVSEFCAAELLRSVLANPEAMTQLGKTDFEAICAEIFVSRGFKVDLFRPTKDDGIDFLAVHDGDTDPVVFAVQCKQPDQIEGKKLGRTTGVPVVREIFGVASAFGFEGAVTITGSRFSPEAKKFAELQPDRIKLHDLSQLQEWIQTYRWNEDEESS